ncbi:flagellar hook-basal body complex protein FliE [Hasllibacter sp. MH4015]|uniref:flagellar hook-basal body complex protein FliE n=1 Tax=Hasllibacter sp. MH4015 TaxID=2854029 RepID=UPI001CD25AEA|nr:flagellar hook-basal body complex protein FliE [Hasllibacter sp. MH4015]
MDIRQTMAAQAYGQTRLTPQPTAPQDGGAFVQAVTSFADTVAQGEAQATAAMTTGADPHSLVTALAQTELAVETAVTIRDRVVEAYQEILRMPV